MEQNLTELKQKAEIAKKMARALGKANTFCSLGYVIVVVVSVFFALLAPIEDAAVRSGALAIFLATTLSGIHLLLVFKVERHFEIADPTFSVWGVRRPLLVANRSGYDTANKIKESQSAFMVRQSNKKSRPIRAEIIRKVILFETFIFAFGTLTWGFVDLAVLNGASRC